MGHKRENSAASTSEPGTSAERDQDRGASPAAYERLIAALEHMRGFIVEMDSEGRNLYVSPSLASTLGFDPREAEDFMSAKAVHGDDRAKLAPLARALRETGQPVQTIFRARHKSGHWVWLETTSATFEATEGEEHAVIFARDISDTRETHEALRESEERFEAVTQNAPDLIVELDEEGCVLFISDNIRRLTGRSASDIIGRTLSEFVASGGLHPEDPTAMDEIFLAASQESSEFTRLKHADGSWRWFSSRFSTYRARDGSQRVLVSARDVTDWYRTQRDLRDSEERYRAITECAHEIISECDESGRVIYVSPAIENVLGFKPSQVMGTTPVPIVDPDHVERIVGEFIETVETNQPTFTAPFRCRHSEGSWRWLESQTIAYERSDRERRFLTVTRDVTERQNLEARVHQAQRLEGLGVLAGGIAHDFNNLLTPILGDTGLSLRELPEDSPVRTRLRRVERTARRAAALTHQMLAYAGKGLVNVEALDLSVLVGDMRQLLESAVARRSTVEVSLAEDLPPIQGDVTQLSQVLLNLTTNASEAIGDGGGTIWIRTGLLAPPIETPQDWPGEPLPQGPTTFVEVEDDGCGMDVATRNKIFDPFFTTKFAGRGLGLAGALGIVRRHAGAIEIYSDPGAGTRFRLLFPAMEAPTATVHVPPSPGSNWRGFGAVLVVDDDPGVREVVAATLESAGLRVFTADDGAAGIETYRRHAGEVDLVVLDRTMPPAGGEACLDGIREIHGSARALFISGYSKDSAEKVIGDRRNTAFLQKPFDPEQLIEKARSLLES